MANSPKFIFKLKVSALLARAFKGIRQLRAAMSSRKQIYQGSRTMVLLMIVRACTFPGCPLQNNNAKTPILYDTNPDSKFSSFLLVQNEFR